ncbi:MAG: cobalamin/Fe3+-siderophore ABC transporter ATP-binding protein [Firmicutes bacterium HGW-Firmicutes-8]|nr:MAG: cobalamin/Fe3+-siderophore ABC transporter ATP-binding protein [Firmicutes bacterium HGW-Firmicutes-8]
MKMLETRDLTVGHEKKPIVEGINLEITQGHLIALLGPNGAGKSTILKSLSGLLAPVKGAIYIHGSDLSRIKRKTLSKVLAVVLTERLNAGFLTSYDVTATGRYPHTGFLGKLGAEDKTKVLDCLRVVNAEKLAWRYFNELSDGEKQKVLLARALAQEPELIILDEPTTHLDVRHKLEVMAILKRLSREKGITVIFSLHEIDLALKSCDTAILVKDGRIVSCGSPEKVGNNEVSALYDIDCAGYNAFMGTIEISNSGEPSVFIVGGAGKATGIYRMLTRNNVGFCTGILHENDVDCHIAETIGVITVKEKPFQNIGLKAYREAQNLIRETSLVVDTGFPIAESNSFNRKLVLEALQDGQRVCTMRDKKENRQLYGDWADEMIYCHTAAEILQHCDGTKTFHDRRERLKSVNSE